MNKEASINYGDPNKEDYISRVFNTSLTFSIVLLIPITILMLLIVNFFPNVFSSDFLDYVYIIFAMVFFVQLRTFFVRYFRIYEKYKIIISFELISNIVLLIGVILFVPKYSLNRLLIILLISNLIIFFYQSFLLLKHLALFLIFL